MRDRALIKDKKALIQNYQLVRLKTEQLCQPLTIEDYVIQSIEDVSPPKWHLAHTTWFFETFILSHFLKNYRVFNPLFHALFNSYYQKLGQPYPRARRGLLARPSVKIVYEYRKYIDSLILDSIHQATEEQLIQLMPVLILGMHHEQQHQELLLMDIKHNYYTDPHYPVYQMQSTHVASYNTVMDFADIEGGVVHIGFDENSFCFDNELPRHPVIIKPYRIATRLVTNAEYQEFIMSDGYKNPVWWLADGWECIQKNNWQHPLYWFQYNKKWHVFTLHGTCELNPNEPVSHVSFYEADAYARFRGMRLPLEAEWEHYIKTKNMHTLDGNFLEKGIYHPIGLSKCNTNNSNLGLGNLWQWTASPYCPYPGYKPIMGALGEYNGKFMSNQVVLKGGSCVTPQSHIRTSYRNFFQPEKRWQFSGIRLASDA